MLELAGSVEALTGPVVTAAAADGDPAALSICTSMGRWLGRGLANLAAVLDPSIFVIGGGVSAAGELLLRPAREEFAHTLTGRGFRPEARSCSPRSARTRAWSAPPTSPAGSPGRADLASRSLDLAGRRTRRVRQDGRPCACSPSTPGSTGRDRARARPADRVGRGRHRLRAPRPAPAALALDQRGSIGPAQRAGRGRRRAPGRREPAAVHPRRRLPATRATCGSAAAPLRPAGAALALLRHGGRTARSCSPARG